MDQSDPGPLADGTHPSVRGAPVQSLAVVAEQDRPVSPLPHSQVDGAGGAWHQRNQGRLVALTDDAQDTMAPLEGHVLDIGATSLAHPQPVQPQQHGQPSVGVVELFGGEQEPTQLAAVQPAPLTGVHGRAPHVLGWVGRDRPSMWAKR